VEVGGLEVARQRLGAQPARFVTKVAAQFAVMRYIQVLNAASPRKLPMLRQARR
jgi:hypothetical protein